MPEPRTSAAPRLPAIYLPHGGGPWTITDLGMGHEMDGLAAYLRNLGGVLPAEVRAVLCISAHWEETAPTVMTGASPPMLYDYSGFPKAAYEFVWPAPGAPDIARFVLERLDAAGFQTTADRERGFDHGTFVPLMLSDPEATTPTFQVSLIRGLDPNQHIRLGRALAPLRDEGVLIVGSGMSYHNLRMWQSAFHNPRLRPRIEQDSLAFDRWLAQTMALDAETREQRLIAWEQSPGARDVHPREEHLLPLMVIAGAAIDGEATLPFRGRIMGAHVSAVHLS